MTSNDVSIARTREVLARTSRAAIAAHEADLEAAVDGVEWERRGFLRALKRRRREGSPARRSEARSRPLVGAAR
jgi:hypothetical protein